MSKSKKLTLNNIKTLENNVFTYKEVLIDAYGQTFKVLIDENFRLSKIESMLKDMVSYTQICNELELETNILFLSNLTLLKNFTDITFTGDVIKDIKLFNSLIDLGIVEKIFNNFDQNQFNKIIETMNKINSNMPKLVETMKDAFNKQSESIKNSVIGEVNATI